MKKRSNPNGSSEDFIYETVYAAARCEEWIKIFAESHNLPSRELTHRVADVLLVQASGTLLGAINRMPSMRTPSAEGSSPLATVAVDDRPRSQVQRIGSRPHRMIACKFCGLSILNVNMGNHVRYRHPVERKVRKDKGKPRRKLSLAIRKRMSAAQQLWRAKRKEAQAA